MSIQCLAFSETSKLVLLTLLLFIPISGTADERMIWQEKLDYVALENISDQHHDNAHPVEFKLKTIVSLLKDIKLEFGKKVADKAAILDFISKKENRSDEMYLFNEEELLKLSKPVSRALAMASPNEDVIFRISSSRKKRFGVSTLSTTGRIFFVGRYLNLIVGDVRVNLEQRYRVRGGPSDIAEMVDYHKLRAFRLDKATRDKSVSSYSFAKNKMYSLKTNDHGEARRDWLLIDVAAVPDDQIHNRSAEISESKSVERVDDVLEDRKQNTEYSGERVERQEDTKKIPLKSHIKTDIEAQLLELKRLYEKGVIPEDIYNRKVIEILDEF